MDLNWDSEKIDYEKVLQQLQKNPTKGMSLLSMSRATGISMPKLRRFFREHQKAFVFTAGNWGYRLNNFPPFSGDVDKIRIALEKEESDRQQTLYWMWFVIVISLLSTLAAVY